MARAPMMPEDVLEGPAFLVQELLQGRSLDQALPLLVDPAISRCGGVAWCLWRALHEWAMCIVMLRPQQSGCDRTGSVPFDFALPRAEGSRGYDDAGRDAPISDARLDGHPPTAASDLFESPLPAADQRLPSMIPDGITPRGSTERVEAPAFGTFSWSPCP